MMDHIKIGKIIKYKILVKEKNLGTEENPVMKQDFLDVIVNWSEQNEKLAKKEAFNGEYTIEVDEKFCMFNKPSQLDKLEAKFAYMAMMSDYTELLED